MMLRHAALATASLLLAPAAVAGEEESVRLNELVVTYNPSVWRQNGLAGFTCVAPDCKGEPSVYLLARIAAWGGPPPCAAYAGTDLDRSNGTPLGEGPVGRLGFAMVSRWSGCRALDAPIIEACGVWAGVVYEFTTSLSQGCNREPAMPEERLIELLEGIRPAPDR